MRSRFDNMRYVTTFSSIFLHIKLNTMACSREFYCFGITVPLAYRFAAQTYFFPHYTRQTANKYRATQCLVSQVTKPLSHRIVRLLDRTIGCYLANVRPIGNVCYDRQQRSHTAIGLSSWWQVIVRLVARVVARSTTIGEDRTTSGSHNDRSYDRSWPPTIDRTINSVGRRMGSDLNPRNISTFYSVSEQPIGGTTGRMVARPVARLIVRPLTIWNSRFQVLT